jgi:hypothetical protein
LKQLLLALWISNFGLGVSDVVAQRPECKSDRPIWCADDRPQAIKSEAVATPGGSFTHPPLFGGDLTLFHSMVTLITEHNGYRMLVVGPTRNWILSLRLEGIRAFGIAEEPWSWDPFYVIAKYGDMPFRSSSFKVISVVAEGGVALIFEADRLLVPSGFLTLQTYDEFRMYGLLKRLGYSFLGHSVAGMHVWRKRDWESA